MSPEQQTNPETNPLYKAIIDSSIDKAADWKRIRNVDIVTGLGLLTLGAITLLVYDPVSILISSCLAGSGITCGVLAILDESERKEALKNPHLDLTH